IIDKPRAQARHQPAGQPLAWVDSVQVESLSDLNGNGYASRFLVQFDADTRLSSLQIYAELSLTDGVQSWPYFVTESLTLQGTRGDDAYQVTTTLAEDYPTVV